VTGHIQRRGASTFRLKYEVDRDPSTGERKIQQVTFHGNKRQAEAELTRLLAARDAGTAVEPDKVSLADYMRSWLLTAEAVSISPKTAERYSQLIECQIVPHLGALPLQKLKGSHIATWHAALLRGGGCGTAGKVPGMPLSARTVGHAHRVLHKALTDAMKRELLFRNPAGLISPPKVTAKEMKILDATTVKAMLEAMRETSIYPQIVVLLLTGMRRGELAAMQWGDVDLDGKKLRVARSIEKTKAGLRIKGPKTTHGRRLIALPAAAVTILRQHRKTTLETRVALGAGRLPDEAFVFGTIDGQLRDPDRLTQDWKRFTAARGLPKVTLQALRHSHASALIAAGTDVVTVSRRLGHGSPTVTLGVYAHLFDKGDEGAAQAIDDIFGNGEKP
jgi:integrase